MSINVTPPYLSTDDRAAAINKKQLNGEAVKYDEMLMATAPDLNMPVYPDGSIGYILIGDSRTVAVDVLCHVNLTPDGFFILAASGQGFDYMMNAALPAAMQIEAAYPEIKEWKYLINMGVNDLGLMDTYKAALIDLAYKKDITIVSVNPVESDPLLEMLGMTDHYIDMFNDEMRTVPNTDFLDINAWLTQNGFVTIDHLHYDKDTTRQIYEKIREADLRKDKRGRTSGLETY